MYTVTITKSGQVTLPKELRDFLGVKSGGRVTFHKTRNGVSINRKLSREEFFDKLDQGKNAKTQSAIRRHAGKTVSELKNEYAASLAGRTVLEDKYGAD